MNEVFKKGFLSILVLLVLPMANASEINVCKAEQGNNNAHYLGLATTKTRLICENSQPGFRPTLVQLYRLNWRLIEVKDFTVVNSVKGKQLRPPVYYLQRDKWPRGYKKTWSDTEANYL